MISLKLSVSRIFPSNRGFKNRFCSSTDSGFIKCSPVLKKCEFRKYKIFKFLINVRKENQSLKIVQFQPISILQLIESYVYRQIPLIRTPFKLNLNFNLNSRATLIYYYYELNSLKRTIYYTFVFFLILYVLKNWKLMNFVRLKIPFKLNFVRKICKPEIFLFSIILNLNHY